MSPDQQKPLKPPRSDLRKRAEELLRTTPTGFSKMPDEGVQRLVQELQVHQIELELQNEELRKAQVELAESRDSYSDLYEFAPVGFLSLDQEGTILKANLTAATMLGTGREELPGMKVSAFVTPESQHAFDLYWREVFSSEAKHECEIGMRGAGGTRLAVRLESVACGPGGDRCCRTALIDITRRKDAETALRTLNVDLGQSLENSTNELRNRLAELRLLSEAVSNLTEGVMITGSGPDWPEAGILFVNDAMCRISGYPRNELVGRSPRVLHGVATKRRVLEWTRSELSAGRSCLVELTNYRKDGSPYEVGLTINPLLDSGGQRSNFVMIHRDITTRRQLEEEVIKAAEEERQRIAHDLHDDLGSFLTGIKLATEAHVGEMARLGSADVGKCGLIAQQVSEAIVKTRSIARGLSPVGPDPQNLMDALQALGRQTEKTTDLKCRCDCPEPVVLDELVVANHLYRIAQEAINNAVKYSGCTGITISLRNRPGTVELRINDNGSGFDQSSAQGGGLGLRIMHYRAHALNASLRIEQGEGLGTSVVCAVPVLA